MPDREKVIRGLEKFKADFKPFAGNRADWQRVDNAIELLKAQEPKKAEWTTKRTQEHDGEWYCSHCGYEPVVMWGENFCPNCGYKMTMPEPPKEET